MSSANKSVKILSGNVDIIQIPDNPKTKRKAHEMLLVRGVLDPRTLVNILTPEYQREILTGVKARELKDAIKTSTVPDIELGMRGGKHRVQEGTCFLYDDVYVIDGLQRISAALEVMREEPELTPHIGCVAFFDTDEAWERERFRILNQERTKLSANVLIRNLQETNESIEMLYKLATADDSFVIKDKISWSQRMRRGELIPASVFCQTVSHLHLQFGPGLATAANEIASQLDRIMGEVGRTTLRDNVKTFFEIIDRCFNLRHVSFVESASCIRRNFLFALAEIFARHQDFWRGKRLFVEMELQRKISKFQTQDPNIAQLCAGTATARDILYEYLLKHINSGKRTRRLTPIEGMEPKEVATTEQPANEAEVTLEVETAETAMVGAGK